MHPLQEQAREHGTPLIAGARVTFLWSGDQPPFLVSDFNGWNPEQGQHWAPRGPECWTQEFTLPPDSYIEYAYLTEPRDEARTPDPHNERTVPNGVGQVNHYFHMPEANETPLSERAAGVRQGQITRHRIENPWFLAGGKRWVHLYRPPVDEPTPLLVVYDAQDYLTRGRITQIVDNLMHKKRMRPLSLALLDNGGPARGLEYSCNDATLGFVMAEVLPLAQENLNLVDPRDDAYGVMGASMGGLMATYTGLRLPEVFGKVLSQSGAFELGESEGVATVLVRHMPVPPLQIWMDVGRFEWLLEPNRRFHSLLAERGYDVTYREFNGGHNYPAWRNDYWRGLEALFG
jgi:enterochelin esterase-like enzyme